MPRFATPQEQDEYVKNAIATLGVLFGREPAPKATSLTPELLPLEPEATCFCGKPPAKLIISDDGLDELVICQSCFDDLQKGYSIRATVSLRPRETADAVK